MEDKKTDGPEPVPARGASALNRREFLGTAAAALFAGALLQVTGCGTDEEPADSGNLVGLFGANHGHSAVITKAMLDAGEAVTLDIKGSADHTHAFELTAQDLANLKAKLHVMKETSETDKHIHVIMYN